MKKNNSLDGHTRKRIYLFRHGEVNYMPEGKVVKEKRNLNLNPYIFNGKYAGTLGRASRSKVVNVSSGGGGLIPIFPLKPGVE